MLRDRHTRVNTCKDAIESALSSSTLRDGLEIISSVNYLSRAVTPISQNSLKEGLSDA